MHKVGFYVIILHYKSIVLVCLFRFIEQRCCVTAVTIHGCVAAILRGFELRLLSIYK